MFLVLAALVSVPIMLLPKPLVLQKRHKARAAQLEQYGRVSPHEDDEEVAAEQGTLRMAAPAGAHHEEEFDFSEIMVHQVSGVLEALPLPVAFHLGFQGTLALTGMEYTAPRLALLIAARWRTYSGQCRYCITG